MGALDIIANIVIIMGIILTTTGIGLVLIGFYHYLNKRNGDNTD